MTNEVEEIEPEEIEVEEDDTAVEEDTSDDDDGDVEQGSAQADVSILSLRWFTGRRQRRLKERVPVWGGDNRETLYPTHTFNGFNVLGFNICRYI